jgi:hypothetical protein
VLLRTNRNVLLTYDLFDDFTDHEDVPTDSSVLPAGLIGMPRGRVIDQIYPGYDHLVVVARNTSTRNSKKGSEPFGVYTLGKNSEGQLGLKDGRGRRGPQCVEVSSPKEHS